MQWTTSELTMIDNARVNHTSKVADTLNSYGTEVMPPGGKPYNNKYGVLPCSHYTSLLDGNIYSTFQHDVASQPKRKTTIQHPIPIVPVNRFYPLWCHKWTVQKSSVHLNQGTAQRTEPHPCNQRRAHSPINSLMVSEWFVSCYEK